MNSCSLLYTRVMWEMICVAGVSVKCMMHGLLMKSESEKRLACWRSQLSSILILARWDMDGWVLQLFDNVATWFLFLLLRELYLYIIFWSLFLLWPANMWHLFWKLSSLWDWDGFLWSSILFLMLGRYVLCSIPLFFC